MASNACSRIPRSPCCLKGKDNRKFTKVALETHHGGLHIEVFVNFATVFFKVSHKILTLLYFLWVAQNEPGHRYKFLLWRSIIWGAWILKRLYWLEIQAIPDTLKITGETCTDQGVAYFHLKRSTAWVSMWTTQALDHWSCRWDVQLRLWINNFIPFWIAFISCRFFFGGVATEYSAV